MGLVWSGGSTVGSEATATITFNDDDVSWLYIDWADGEDNSLENAIYQWHKLETDAKSIELTHIYTKAGSYRPIIRTINSEGFLSKYFYSGTVTNLPEPKEERAGIGQLTVSDTNPIAITRIENKRVKSGIDNSIFDEGPKNVYLYRPPILASGNTAGGSRITVQITYLESNPTNMADTGAGDENLGYNNFIKTVEKNVTGSSVSIALPEGAADDNIKISKILEVRQKNAKHISDSKSDINDFNKIKTFLIASSSADGKFYPITYVSNGDPIKKASERKVKIDLTQSRTKASNKSIDKYYIDDGKVFFNVSGNRWQASSSTKLDDDTKFLNATKDVSYTYMARPDGVKNDGVAAPYAPFFSGNNFLYSTADEKVISNQFPLNDWNQFFDQNHLVRANVGQNSSSPKFSELDTFKLVYRITPALKSEYGGNAYPASLYLDYDNVTDIKTANYTSGSYWNDVAYPINISGWNAMTFSGATYPSPRVASEYLVLGNETKVDKIFFNTTPYARDLNDKISEGTYTTVTGTTVAGVYYLATGTLVLDDKWTQYAEWKPLNFKDTTKISRQVRDASNTKFVTYEASFTKPGFIEYEMPDDWAKVSISGLTGGIFARTATPVSEPINPHSKAIAATYSGSFSSGTGEKRVIMIKFSTDLSKYTDEQIGSFRYTYQVDGGTNDNFMYWVISSSIAENKLFLLSGQSTTFSTYNTANAVNGDMRRINIYDVFDGGLKTFLAGSNVGSGDLPHMASGSGVQPHTYLWSGGANINFLKNNFKDIYPMKIVLSGNHFENNATAGIELWDAIPFNNSASEVVVQRDNTAFDLSFMELTSNVSVAHAGTFYSAISKNGKVTVVRTGTPIQTISFGGHAMGDESNFKFSAPYEAYNTLHQLRRIEAEAVRVMWDERQKDGTYVRFFGFIQNVTEVHQVGGPRATKPFNFSMVVEEICLIDADGNLMSDITPLGGLGDASSFT